MGAREGGSEPGATLPTWGLTIRPENAGSGRTVSTHCGTFPSPRQASTLHHAHSLVKAPYVLFWMQRVGSPSASWPGAPRRQHSEVRVQCWLRKGHTEALHPQHGAGSHSVGTGCSHLSQVRLWVGLATEAHGGHTVTSPQGQECLSQQLFPTWAGGGPLCCLTWPRPGTERAGAITRPRADPCERGPISRPLSGAMN